MSELVLINCRAGVYRCANEPSPTVNPAPDSPDWPEQDEEEEVQEMPHSIRQFIGNASRVPMFVDNEDLDMEPPVFNAKAEVEAREAALRAKRGEVEPSSREPIANHLLPFEDQDLDMAV